MYDEDEELKEWYVPVTWEMCGLITVKAKTASDALEKVNKDEEDYPLPKDSYYIDGSFKASTDEVGIVEMYTKMYNKNYKGDE